MPDKDVLAIYQDFCSTINTDEQLLEFLSYLPENQGGLYPVAVSLFHPSEAVRKLTVTLFARIDKLKVRGSQKKKKKKSVTDVFPKAGSGFISSMNKFQRIAYDRNKVLLDK